METLELILTDRNYKQDREAILVEIKDEKSRKLISDLADERYHYRRLFPKTDGWGARRQIRNRIKLLKNVEPLLPRLLLQGEEVRFVTRGIYSSFAEQYFLGWASLLLNRTVFIFTNYRIVMLNSDGKDRPLHMKWHLPYDQIKKFSTGMLSSSMTFKLKDKVRMVFAKVPSADRKPLKALVPEMIRLHDAHQVKMPHHQCRDNLCTACLMPVPKGQYVCPNCREEFIKPMKPALMSLCLPCLGDFYLGHRFLASLEALGYALGFFIFFAGLVSGEAEGVIAFLIFLLFAHGIDSMVTHHIASKGLVAVRNAWGKK